ncbi:MAG: hypothetical protein LJE62_13920 [Silicimonas sp.]|jgi:hypothetical protein|nr:hypothetical protein [Silicimonas sp.]
MNILIGSILLVALAAWLWSKLPDAAARERALAETRRLGLFILPRISVALIGAAFFADLLPEERVRTLFGSGAGLTGLLLATVLGPLTPGGPFVCFAVAAAGLHVGATPQAVLAYVTSWALFSMTKTLAYEVPLMGVRFTARRFALSFPIPFLVAAAGYFVS